MSMTMDELEKALFDNAPHDKTQFGNECYRTFAPSERYIVDFAKDFVKSDWKQFDTSQDAHYFGVWVNPEELKILTYAEGDWNLIVCERIGAYNDEIRFMNEFYSEGFEFKVIDENGTTEYKQNRNDFFAEKGEKE